MSDFPTDSQAVHDAAIKGDFDKVKALVGAGAELNVLDDSGQTLLESIVFFLSPGLSESPPSFRVVMLRLLFQLGANPNLLGKERCSALTTCMLAMDAELMEVLLEAGADPNLPSGFSPSESFYDWAEFDYRYNVWLKDNPSTDSIDPPDEPAEADLQTEETWLKHLDRVAIKYGVQRPEHLFLLRKYGAKTAQELGLLS